MEINTMEARKITLRENQKATIDQTKKLIYSGNKHIIIKMPTGGGKTITMEFLQKEFKNVIITTPRINLTHQTANERDGWGIIQGNKRVQTNGNVTVATLQTILSLVKKDKFNFNNYGAVFIDECHMNATKASKDKKKKYTMGNLIEDLIGHGITVIGFTATPYRHDGKPLDIWEKAKMGTPKEWQSYEPYFEHGYLVQPITKKTGSVNKDLLKLSSTKDYTEESQVEAISESQIDVVETILKYREGLTLIMAVNIEHAEAIHNDLISRGERSIITHSKNNVEVKEAVDALKSGKVDFAVSIGTMHTGTDIPQLETIVQACLTKSRTKRDQFAGRGARCYEGKEYFNYLDLFGSCDELGLPFSEPILEDNEVSDKKNRVPKCKECGCTTPYKLIHIEEEIGSTLKTFKCVECGNEDTKIEHRMVETCEYCNTVQEVKGVLSYKGKAVFKCSHCDEYSYLADLTPSEMIVTFSNRNHAIKQITDFAKIKLKDDKEMLERFLVSFSMFSKYAKLDHLSAIIDFVGDLKAVRKVESINKVIDRMDDFYSSHVGKKYYLIDGMYNVFGDCNYELEDFIQKHLDEKSVNNAMTHKDIVTIMKEWSKKHDIHDTKKYMNLVKRFTTRILK